MKNEDVNDLISIKLSKELYFFSLKLFFFDRTPS